MKWNPHQDILHSSFTCKVKLLSFCPAPDDAAYILHRKAPAFRVWTVMTVKSSRGAAPRQQLKIQTILSEIIPLLPKYTPHSNSWLPVLASELPGSPAACGRSPHSMKLSKGLVRLSFLYAPLLAAMAASGYIRTGRTPYRAGVLHRLISCHYTSIL